MTFALVIIAIASYWVGYTVKAIMSNTNTSESFQTLIGVMAMMLCAILFSYFYHC